SFQRGTGILFGKLWLVCRLVGLANVYDCEGSAFYSSSFGSSSLFKLCQSSARSFQFTSRSDVLVQTSQKSGSSDLGLCSGLSSFISTRIGSGDAQPNKIAFLVGRIGSSCKRPPMLSGTSRFTNSWSRSFTIL